ncbi:acylphosphatase [Spirosoma utsteinense]|uniref:Acylphosphatase n=1 Tax=Spirosoma utsteinense TaxID=2585773 RepID=A0ABR6W3F6_9BACT|nr:acylphosphatase [Spirosoma utsteinense]MBC3784840.1 acylphosphatase [Spirosoma utsteinense]MBC3791122.1 acylphosphatase [Spirosoma utsteinense]
MKENRIIRVNGQLGGTLFRQEARQKGEKLGLMGHAQIEPNGDLRIDAEGEPDVLDTFVDWCRTGPEGTDVQSVRVTDGEVQGFDRFMEVR